MDRGDVRKRWVDSGDGEGRGVDKGDVRRHLDRGNVRRGRLMEKEVGWQNVCEVV